MKNKQTFGSLMLLMAAIAWGLSYSVQSLAAGLSIFTIGFFKCAGGLVLLPLAIINKERFNKKTILGGALIGIVASCGVMLQQKGIELSSAANASFISSLYIIFTPILGILIGRKPKKKIWIAILITLIGMYLLCIDGQFELRIGDLILVISAILFALQIILIDKFIQDVDAIAFTSVQQIFGAIFSGALALIIDKPDLSVVSNYIPHIIYMSLVSGALAQLLQNRFQRDVDPSVASIVMSLESVFGALFGWVLLNQVLSIKEIIGCILIFIAMLIAE